MSHTFLNGLFIQPVTLNFPINGDSKSFEFVIKSQLFIFFHPSNVILYHFSFE